MARLNIKNIENVEGKYHLMFFEGKKMIENANNDLRFSIFSFLLFTCLLLLFVIISGFNLFYIGFMLVFLIFFLSMVIYLLRVKRKGKKQCILAVQSSRANEIVAKQVDNRGAGKAIVKSMSSTLDKYDAKQKYPSFLQKYKRKRKHDHLVGIITEFEKEEKKKK